MQVLRDAGDSGGASGSGKWDPRGRKGGTKGSRVFETCEKCLHTVYFRIHDDVHSPGPSSVFKIVKMIMERNFQPVIIFSFSKKECEAYALQVAKLDFNKGM